MPDVVNAALPSGEMLDPPKIATQIPVSSATSPYTRSEASQSAGVAIAKKALIMLREPSLDERRFVWRAVAASIWKLGHKRPDITRPERARWLEDERRVTVAREAIKYL